MSTVAVDVQPGAVFGFYSATIGKKVVMAVTGLVLFGFVVGHLVGNLQIFLGPEKINHYSELLRSAPALLWGVRIGLLVVVSLHVWSSFQLWLLGRRARPIGYKKKVSVDSTYASRTMLWSGPIIAAFVVYHLLHLTFGTVLPLAHDASNRIDVYSNVVNGFRVVPISVFYIVAMGALCLHLYHGLWSMFQTVGVNHPRYTPALKRCAMAVAFLIAAGNISIPVAVLAGVLRPVAGGN